MDILDRIYAKRIDFETDLVDVLDLAGEEIRRLRLAVSRRYLPDANHEIQLENMRLKDKVKELQDAILVLARERYEV